ncbi:Rhodanese-like domain-containing protein [Xylaria flabelliformis]|nr:Rhodanese-like domain-containing protein [Xylaria flabelliformis]
MSLITLSNLERITAARLAERLLAVDATNTTASGQAAENSIAIVDVRDDDYIGGHIRTSLHFPSRSLDATMPTLLRNLADKETVVFHCALSQQRGPSAALRYLRAREADATANTNGKENASEKKNKQKVYVLDRGFTGWQEVYGTDERLTEGYRKEIWEDY